MSFAPKTESPALSPSTPERRNTFQEAQAVPFGNGFFRVAPKWVSDRFNDHWSNGKQSGQAYCSVVGILCHGPIDFVQGIYSGGKLVAWPDIGRPDNPLDPDYHSVTIEFGGADPDLGTSNRVRVHWGREDQPVDSWLVSTSGQDHPPYPGQVVVVFERLHCGQIQANSQQRPALPNIEFSVARLPSPSVPSGLRLPAALGAARWRGINLVSGLWDALTHPRAGAGLTSAALDEADWVAKAGALESGAKPAAGLSGEDVYVSPLLSGSSETEKVVNDALSYIDGWLHTVGGRIRVDWYPNDGTAAGTLPEISEHDMVEPPKVRTGSLAEAPTTVVVECLEGDTGPNELVEAAETANVPFVREITGETSVRKLQRPWFTSREIAGRYASRAAAMATIPEMDGECLVRLHRAVRLDNTPLRVGDKFSFNYGPQAIVVQARLTERLEDETTATLRWKRERGVSSQPYVPAADPRAVYTLPDPPTPTTNDWVIAEAPRGLSEVAAVVALVRRPSDALSGLRLYLDEDDNWVTGSTLLGPQGFAARVTLSGAMGAADTSCTLTGTDPDVSPTLGSGATSTEQTDDTLIMLMGTEWISLGSVVSAGAGAYTVGLARGRLGSIAAAQASGTYGWVVRRDRVTLWGNAVFAQLASRYFKIAYFHALADGPLSASKTVTFADRAPGIVTSLAAAALPGAIKLTWNNPADTDLLGVQIYESASTTQPPSPSWFVAYPGNAFTRDDLSGGVTKYFWIVTVDQNDNVSAAVGPVNATTGSSSAGADAYTIVFDMPAAVIACDPAGVPNSGELGVGGRVVTTVSVNKGATVLTATTSTPGPGEFRIALSGSVVNGTATFGTDTVRLDTATADTGKVPVKVELEGTTTYFVLNWPFVKARHGSTGTSAWTAVTAGTATVDGSFAYKLTGANGWDSSVYSQEGCYRGATMGCVIGALSNIAFGLDSNPGSDHSHTSIDYCFRLWQLGQIDIMEGGTTVASNIGTQVANTTRFSITYDNDKVRYYVDGVLKRTTTVAADKTLFFDSSLYEVVSPAAVLRNITFGGVGAIGAPGVNGTNGTNGTNGSGYNGTSTTSLSFGTGSKSFTTQAGLAYTVGSILRLIDVSNPAQFMEGPIDSYSGTSMQFTPKLYVGTGSKANWLLTVGASNGFGPQIRGQYSAGTTYYLDSVRTDIVYVGPTAYRANNPAKHGLNTWGTPGSSSDWVAADATMVFGAARLFLIDDATIAKTLVMGDGATADAGIIRSAGATALTSGSGFYLNPRSSGHSNAAVARIGNPAGPHILWDGTALTINGDKASVVNSLVNTDDAAYRTWQGSISANRGIYIQRKDGLAPTMALHSAGSAPSIQFTSYGGTSYSSPSATQSGLNCRIDWSGHDGTTTRSIASIFMRTLETVSSTAAGSQVIFQSNDTGTISSKWAAFQGHTLSFGDIFGLTRVLRDRRTGWAVATGTKTRTTFDASTVTLTQLAERVAALIDDLHDNSGNGHGLIGT